MKLNASVLLLSVALLAPCSAWAAEQAEAAAPAVATEEGAADKGKKAKAKVVEISPPQDGKGKIVFFRAPKFVGGAIGYKVREGETVLGNLFAGKYFVAEVEPGAHEYAVHSETKDVLALEVEAGETYYVQGGVSMGVLAGRPNLSPATQADFDAISAKLKERSK
ncbi:DUF2846 domain-containing protein [Lysobacter yananisis]|uniref:DUF2846 domain-containing protein n=1 Tax=Lysobacter yananisis TaxID=1003114 RepID=A0ABY9P7L4_9GAMM|nr:DUF2846 domain-containing protein [Lysobacter yananisis]WMT03067.1 DUF2846 domain-containing protein [Lysobacter yananisis]